jgi:hypothetical protein
MFMVVAANIKQGMIAALGFDPDILRVALVAWIITGLTMYRRLALIVLTLILCVGANLPQ